MLVVEDLLTTIFDYVTIADFLIAAFAFLILTERDARTLVRVLISGIVFAIANQVGNHGFDDARYYIHGGRSSLCPFAIRAGLSGSSQ